jgi:TM2 domain-containing membrane protein YozV
MYFRKDHHLSPKEEVPDTPPPIPSTSQGSELPSDDHKEDGMAERVKGPDEKFCYECGELIRIRAEICPKCGVRQPIVHATSGLPSGGNRLVATLFAMFLGGFGIHKFYLGQIGLGIVYLLFCWTFIPAIVGFIEGIIFLTMTDEPSMQSITCLQSTTSH